MKNYRLSVLLIAILLCLSGLIVALPAEGSHGGNANVTTNTSGATATTKIATTPKSTVSQSKVNTTVTTTTDAVSDVSSTVDDANESGWSPSTIDPEATTPKTNGTLDTTSVGDTSRETDVSSTTDTVDPSKNVDEIEATSDAANDRPTSTGNSSEKTKTNSLPTNAARGNVGEISNTVIKNVGPTADTANANRQSGLDIASDATAGVIKENLNASPHVTKTDENGIGTVKKTTPMGRPFKPVATPSLSVVQSETVEMNTAPNTTPQLSDTASGGEANADRSTRTVEANDPETHPSESSPTIPAHPTKTAELIGVTVTAGVVLHRPEIGTLATHANTVGVFSKPKLGDRVWWPFMPLRYSKYDDSDPLEQEVRAELHDHIERAPGTYLSQLDDRMDVSLSTIRHHLRILEDEKIVTNAKIRIACFGGGDRTVGLGVLGNLEAVFVVVDRETTFEETLAVWRSVDAVQVGLFVGGIGSGLETHAEFDEVRTGD
ncbi:helix-turn-helix domain-containing protein [Haladaptatus sp. W1]|uniref:helix-turn-helix domain-containing protein n=1 Tax=Haladaptatus sp. W1 TaxID=1897478 RepID=UPI000A543C1F|nr:helix-turn-helix domain-containing protein [Haladaptatus sp. W1]